MGVKIDRGGRRRGGRISFQIRREIRPKTPFRSSLLFFHLRLAHSAGSALEVAKEERSERTNGKGQGSLEPALAVIQVESFPSTESCRIVLGYAEICQSWHS